MKNIWLKGRTTRDRHDQYGKMVHELLYGRELSNVSREMLPVEMRKLVHFICSSLLSLKEWQWFVGGRRELSNSQSE